MVHQIPVEAGKVPKPLVIRKNETAGHQEKGETVCEDLAGRRCP
jgi:hypothetical protein